jgi:hypothetical protein
MGQTTIESYVTALAEGTTDADLYGIDGGVGKLIPTDTFATQTELDALVISGGGITVASEAEAKAGSNNTKAMTPLRVKDVMPYVDARSFGATGDGVADDTAELQAWIDYLTTNHRVGFLPKGTYLVTSTLTAASTYGWGIIGEKAATTEATVIKQGTNNIPILQLGTTQVSSSCHSINIENIGFTYSNVQAAANTNARCLVLHEMIYYSSFKSLHFQRGYYGITAGDGAEYSHSNIFDDLYYSAEMSGGALRFADGTGATINNTFGKIIIYATTMVGPLIEMESLSNTTFSVIEILYANLGPILMSLGGATGFVNIGSVKLENGDYDAATTLIDCVGNTTCTIGDFQIIGSTMNLTPAAGQLNLLRVGNGVTEADREGRLAVGMVHVLDGLTITGDVIVAAGGGRTCPIEIGNVITPSSVKVQSTGFSSACEYITVSAWANGHLSADKGDASYTVVHGDPTTAYFGTTLTASRNVVLPAKADGNNFNGLTYTLVFKGSINGANTAVIKEGANTIRTQSTDSVSIDYTWRRGGAGGGEWLMTRYSTLP